MTTDEATQVGRMVRHAVLPDFELVGHRCGPQKLRRPGIHPC